MDYQVIVPMAGQGQRFVDSGYSLPKPLVPVSGVPLVDRVVSMFSDAAPITFIVNDKHARETPLVARLQALRNSTSIVVMPEHKRGPVWTVAAAFDLIVDDMPVFVAYCDGAVKFDHAEFEAWVTSNQLDGCLLTHSGFHPHTLSATKMAYLRTQGVLVTDVKEKASYTEQPETEHASSGVYWFSSGRLVKDYFAKALESQAMTYNGEHYVTLAYRSLIADNLRVGFFDTDYVEILGTPEEVANYEAWQVLMANPYFKTPAQAAACFSYYDRIRTQRKH